MSNREKVHAILQAWEDAASKDVPVTYDSGPTIELGLMAQIAINVLTDWDKR
jgi:hypothetical protein